MGVQRVDIPLSQNPYASPFTSLGAEILDNFYLEFANSATAKVKYYQVGAQGLELIYSKTESNGCRGLFTTGGFRTFGVWGAKVYEIKNNGKTRSQIGTIKTYSGIVRFAENSTQMILVDGSFGYIFNLTSGSFQRITDTYFPGVDNASHGPSHVACIDSYFLVNSVGTNKYYWSSPGYVAYAFDASSPSVLNYWNGLQYGEKKAQTDDIIGMIGLSNHLYLWGKNSMEIHYDTGNTYGQLWSRLDNAVVSIGCLAKDSICRYSNNVYWLGRDQEGTVGMFTCGTDFAPKMISPRGIQQRISSYANLENCWTNVFFIDGHAFISWTFPSGTATDGSDEVTGVTWCYDITTDSWTKRTRWDDTTGTSYRWQAQHCTYNWSTLMFGDESTNALYDLSGTKFENDNADGSGTNYINGVITSPVGYMQNRNLIYRYIQLSMQQGMALRTGVGSAPQAMLSCSRDAGQTWGYERSAPIGLTGKYDAITRWTLCGTGRNRVQRFRITAPIRRVILGCTAEIEDASR